MQGEGAYGRVYKGLRGGVQDVAVKQLSHTGDGQLQKFIEVGAAGVPWNMSEHTYSPRHLQLDGPALPMTPLLTSVFPKRWLQEKAPVLTF